MQMPDCVPEYYRTRQEDADIRFVRQMQRKAHYLANRRKISAAAESGLPVLSFGGYGPCRDCPDADHDTMSAADDDFGRVICRDPACPHHRGQAT